MKKHKIPLLLVVGICLVLISVSLLLAFHVRGYLGNQHSQKIVLQLNEILPDRTTGIPGTYSVSGMPILEIESVDYVAILEIPVFGITLLVADNWDNKHLHSAPGRFWGSAYDNTLVIGGTDSPQQFSFCAEIDNGATITVTDMTGAKFTYTVFRVDRAKDAETQWLAQTDCDLTLFCRDAYTFEYIAVRCVFA